MINVTTNSVQIFNGNRVKVDAIADMGISYRVSRSFYYDFESEPSGEQINAAIEMSMKSIQTYLYMHLASLADSAQYQNWASKLNLETIVPATPKAANPSVVEAPKVEAPKVEAPKVEAPKVEAPKVEAPKVEAKEEPKAEVKEAPKAESPKTTKKKEAKAEAPKVEDVVKNYTKGDKDCTAAIRQVAATILGSDWAKNDTHKTAVVACAAEAATQSVICFRNGEIAEEFKEFVKAFVATDSDNIDL